MSATTAMRTAIIGAGWAGLAAAVRATQAGDAVALFEAARTPGGRARRVVAEDGTVTGFKMRCEQSKLTTVKALHQAGLETIAAGDSFNDLGMIKASKAGFLFKSTDSIKADNPTIPAFEEYAELMAGIKAAL